MISLVDEGAQHEDIIHTVYTTPKNRQMDGLVNVLLWENSSKGLVFCHTRAETIEVANRLTQERFSSCCLHGDMSQRERNHALSMFVSGRVSHLVATNVAARGLDIPEVEHVFQFGLPSDAETFIHRSGRTGRAGNEGRDILVLTMTEAYKLRGCSGIPKYLSTGCPSRTPRLSGQDRGRGTRKRYSVYVLTDFAIPGSGQKAFLRGVTLWNWSQTCSG